MQYCIFNSLLNEKKTNYENFIQFPYDVYIWFVTNEIPHSLAQLY